jgi:hypothetical protein
LFEACIKPWSAAQHRILAADNTGDSHFDSRDQLRGDIPMAAPGTGLAGAKVFRQRAGNVIPYFGGQGH